MFLTLYRKLWLILMFLKQLSVRTKINMYCLNVAIHSQTMWWNAGLDHVWLVFLLQNLLTALCTHIYTPHALGFIKNQSISHFYLSKEPAFSSLQIWAMFNRYKMKIEVHKCIFNALIEINLSMYVCTCVCMCICMYIYFLTKWLYSKTETNCFSHTK